MADVTVKILVPAQSYALISLDELKVATGGAATGDDAQMQWLIDAQSSVISTLCNRVFAKETVRETWRDLGGDVRRLYLTHWPVKEEDIDSVMTADASRLDWELDEGQGKLSIFTARNEPIIVEYTGGYELPDEAPMALKQAVALLVSTSKSEAAAASLSGVRMISHKESRVMFHSPTSGGSSGGSSTTTSQTQDTVKALLGHYIKHWI